MESSEIEVIDKYRSEIAYNINSKGFVQVSLKGRFLEPITKKDIDQYIDLFEYAKKAAIKKGFNVEEIKK